KLASSVVILYTVPGLRRFRRNGRRMNSPESLPVLPLPHPHPRFAPLPPQLFRTTEERASLSSAKGSRAAVLRKELRNEKQWMLWENQPLRERQSKRLAISHSGRPT
ncbi:hypothetical protein PMAYCL1PPCAC_01683, partial [Pristionchus mayeri]